MRGLIAAAACLLCSVAYGEGSIAGTFSGNDSSSSILVQEHAIVMVGSENGQDFGSGTVTVEFRGTDSEWYASATSFTTVGVVTIKPGLPVELRITLTGATSPDLDYVIRSDSPIIIQ